MITMSNFGNHGRLGNQLFQYASMMGIARALGHDAFLPEWKYEEFFKSRMTEPNSAGIDRIIEESSFHYNSNQFNSVNDQEKVYDIRGYYQSQRYWKHCEKSVIDKFAFKDSLIKKVKSKHPFLFKKKPVLAIHVRRGDYIDNPNYETVPIQYYMLALEKFDLTKYDLLFFSDDIAWCRVHFQCLENAWFSEGKSDIEDLCLMTQCDDYILSNSSFAWFGAYLSGNLDKIVIRPEHYFRGKLLAECDTKDFWPSDWISVDWKTKRIDLKDVTFTIPVQFDHKDRKQNLDLCVCMLQHHFDTNIIVMENNGQHFANQQQHSIYMLSNHPYFHRTRMLNDMAYFAEKFHGSKIVANWDADVIIAPMQILEAVKKIRAGADMVYPYDGTFARMPRHEWFKKIAQRLDIGIVGYTHFKGMAAGSQVSVGGAVFFNRDSFIKGGMENENFISFGPEDSERYDRFTKLRFKVERVDGPLYHVDHFVGPDSGKRHKFFATNKLEYQKVASMTEESLAMYVLNFPWLYK